MKNSILVVDDSKNNVNLLEMLINKFSEYAIDIKNDYTNIINEYTNDKYEYVIFDHNCKVSNELMTYILTNNPEQKCILLSDSINCPVSCDTCLSSFKFVRLLKPINPKSVLHYIDKNNEFICPNKNVFDSLDTLDKLFIFINLEMNIFYTQKQRLEDKILIRPIASTTIRLDELERIDNNINKKYFKLEILPDNSLEITKI